MRGEGTDKEGERERGVEEQEKTSLRRERERDSRKSKREEPKKRNLNRKEENSSSNGAFPHCDPPGEDDGRVHFEGGVELEAVAANALRHCICATAAQA